MRHTPPSTYQEKFLPSDVRIAIIHLYEQSQQRILSLETMAHNFVGADPDQRQARNNNGSKFTVLSVATQRSWKNTDDEWASKRGSRKLSC